MPTDYFYIKTNPLPESTVEFKYLKLASEITGAVAFEDYSPNSDSHYRWKVSLNVDGTFKIYSAVSRNGLLFELTELNGDVFVDYEQIANCSWSIIRNDIIPGKVYSIRSATYQKYITVGDVPYIVGQNNLWIENPDFRKLFLKDRNTNNTKFSQQYYRFEYNPLEDSYWIYSCSYKGGYYRVIDLIRNSGQVADNCVLQIFKVGKNNNVDLLCQQFKLLSGESNDNCRKYKLIVARANNFCIEAKNSTTVRIGVYSQSLNTELEESWYIDYEEERNNSEEYYRSSNIVSPIIHNNNSTIVLNSTYGPRQAWDLDEVNNGQSSNTPSEYHSGIDIAAHNDYILSPFNGRIVAAKTTLGSDSRGLYVIVEADDIYVYNTNIKLRVILQHLSSVSVSQNQLVEAGDIVGVSGGSGSNNMNAYGEHLHMGVIVTGGTNSGVDNTMDPLMLYFKNKHTE